MLRVNKSCSETIECAQYRLQADSGSCQPILPTQNHDSFTTATFFVILAGYFHFRPWTPFDETQVLILTWYPPCAIMRLPLIGCPPQPVRGIFSKPLDLAPHIIFILVSQSANPPKGVACTLRKRRFYILAKTASPV